VESNKSCLEADLVAGLLDNHLFSLILLISVIKFWDLFDDPEGLSIKLLLQIWFKEISKAEFITDSAISKKITKSGSVVFDTHLGLFDEVLELSIDFFADFGILLHEKTEQSQEVNKSSNG
jgi:hypothetical protein